MKLIQSSVEPYSPNFQFRYSRSALEDNFLHENFSIDNTVHFRFKTDNFNIPESSSQYSGLTNQQFNLEDKNWKVSQHSKAKFTDFQPHLDSEKGTLQSFQSLDFKNFYLAEYIAHRIDENGDIQSICLVQIEICDFQKQPVQCTLYLRLHEFITIPRQGPFILGSKLVMTRYEEGSEFDKPLITS